MAPNPGEVGSTEGETSLPVEPEAFDADKWAADGPTDTETFGAWVSRGAHHKDDLLAAAALQGDEAKNFGSLVRVWAKKNGLDDAELAEQGVDLDELTDEPTTEPVTGETGTATDDDTQVATTQHGGGNGHGNSGNSGSGGGNAGGNGNGRGHN